MQTIDYIGPHDAVEIDLPDGRTKTVEHGKSLETTDAHAELLLEQESNWKAARRARSKE